jgi:spermidine synthase
MDWKTFSLVGRSFARVFPDSLLVSTCFGEYGGDYLLVGFKGKERLALEYVEQKLVYARKSRNVILTDPRLVYKLILSEDLKRLFGPGNVNTDSRPRLEFAAPKLMYHDDERISKKLESAKQTTLGTRTRNILRQVNGSVDFQIDVVAYALSIFSPFRDMFDLSGATVLQKDRLFELLEGYCLENEVDYSIFNEHELKQRCLSTQIESIQRNKALLQGSSHSCVYLAGLYNMAGDRPQAIRYYTEALRMNPGDAVSHNKLGAVLEVQGRMIEARGHYSEALRIDPAYAEAHNNLGNVLANEGKTDEAIHHLSQALRIDPSYAVAHNNLGCVLANQGRTDEAIHHLSQALRIDPGLAKAHNNLGVVLLRKGQIEEAVVHFREALQRNPDFLSAHYNLKQAAGLRGK